ncbi:2-oxoacid:ferredoxin oxidoreductase subunit gamma [Clostridiales bacterium PH28_bin88]|nr:2-oxoacid:ferredoxin oxidoreductase subunit gamma [Clostridiales bacterium PH28_bin88]
MLHEVVVAGFGGQGVLLTGQLLAYAGMLEDKQVAWIPSYGPEMRGGTANCTVTVSEQEISSPVVEEPSAALIFNLPSLAKFESRVRPGGILLINSSLVDRKSNRKDLHVYEIPANEIADTLGNGRVANMVMLGAYLELTGAVSVASVMKALEKVLPEHRHNLLPLNQKAMEMGAKAVRKVAAIGA